MECKELTTFVTFYETKISNLITCRERRGLCLCKRIMLKYVGF